MCIGIAIGLGSNTVVAGTAAMDGDIGIVLISFEVISGERSSNLIG